MSSLDSSSATQFRNILTSISRWDTILVEPANRKSLAESLSGLSKELSNLREPLSFNFVDITRQLSRLNKQLEEEWSTEFIGKSLNKIKDRVQAIAHRYGISPPAAMSMNPLSIAIPRSLEDESDHKHRGAEEVQKEEEHASWGCSSTSYNLDFETTQKHALAQTQRKQKQAETVIKCGGFAARSEKERASLVIKEFANIRNIIFSNYKVSEYAFKFFSSLLKQFENTLNLPLEWTEGEFNKLINDQPFQALKKVLDAEIDRDKKSDLLCRVVHSMIEQGREYELFSLLTEIFLNEKKLPELLKIYESGSLHKMDKIFNSIDKLKYLDFSSDILECLRPPLSLNKDDLITAYGIDTAFSLLSSLHQIISVSYSADPVMLKELRALVAEM